MLNLGVDTQQSNLSGARQSGRVDTPQGKGAAATDEAPLNTASVVAISSRGVKLHELSEAFFSLGASKDSRLAELANRQHEEGALSAEEFDRLALREAQHREDEGVVGAAQSFIADYIPQRRNRLEFHGVVAALKDTRQVLEQFQQGAPLQVSPESKRGLVGTAEFLEKMKGQEDEDFMDNIQDIHTILKVIDKASMESVSSRPVTSYLKVQQQ